MGSCCALAVTDDCKVVALIVTAGSKVLAAVTDDERREREIVRAAVERGEVCVACRTVSTRTLVGQGEVSMTCVNIASSPDTAP